MLLRRSNDGALMAKQSTTRSMRSGVVHAFLIASAVGAVLLGVVPSAFGQPRTPTVFGSVTWGNAAADDSEIGNIAMFGGEILVPIRGALRVGVGVETGQIDKTHFGSEFRETGLTISALGEWPRSRRVRGLAGGGVGWMFQRTRGIVDLEQGEVRPFRYEHTAGVLHGRGGLVGNIGDRLRIRAEAVLWVGGGITWLVGGRLAMGYEF